MELSKENQSESVQMYLVTIYRLREQEHPVPMPLLVEEMGLTPASINEMCRKSEKEHLLKYVPYSGVNLTEIGEELAREILRKHRLWEVFLVGNLGFDFEEAHTIACQLEHYTPDDLADRLEGFLEYPQVNPRGEPIPWSKSSLEQSEWKPLLDLSPGDKAQITHIKGDKIETGYLLKNNMKPGQEVLIRAVDDSSMLILNQGEHLVLSRDLAEKVFIQILVD
ncbi:MAG: metal-dependent transcriptional regulator [Anaerolineales bacterium]|nr:metal-dependent transcriptional regulator [Anaerolineales bacterium]